jgi:hypothetical protein
LGARFHREGDFETDYRVMTVREQAEKRRQEKLVALRRKVKTGSLVIRQMTPEERRINRVLPRKAAGL